MRRLFALAFVASLCLAPAASAHHSFAMYDPAKVMTLKGTLKIVQWNNPHVVIWLVGGPDGMTGEPQTWTVELTSPGNLTRLGWTRHTLNVGDKVSVEINPLRSGEHGGGFRSATLANGQVLTARLTELEKAAAGKP